MPDDASHSQDLRVVSSTEGDSSVVAAEGELDASTADSVRGALDEVFAEGRSSVVLDLAGITFIDSSGLSVLIYAFKEADERDGRVILRDPSPAVIHLLEITGQTDRFLNARP